MKETLTRASLLIALAAGLLAQGCGKAERYGEVMGAGRAASIREILANPQAYAGKTVKVDGEIITECPAGCWFEVKEGPAVLYVDIGRYGLAIPQHVGRKVTVEGTVVVEGTNAKLEGRGVAIK